jgi:hypothetical protein
MSSPTPAQDRRARTVATAPIVLRILREDSFIRPRGADQVIWVLVGKRRGASVIHWTATGRTCAIRPPRPSASPRQATQPERPATRPPLPGPGHLPLCGMGIIRGCSFALHARAERGAPTGGRRNMSVRRRFDAPGFRASAYAIHRTGRSASCGGVDRP